MTGLKCENRGSVVTIEQSRRPDRTRHSLSPIAIGKASSSSTQKLTVPRLHFSETTANNMRKKGKQNPNQRYFSLVITVVATVNGRSYQLCALESERIIVRSPFFSASFSIRAMFLNLAHPANVCTMSFFSVSAYA